MDFFFSSILFACSSTSYLFYGLISFQFAPVFIFHPDCVLLVFAMIFIGNKSR